MERMFSRADLRKLLVPLMVEQALAMTIGMADTVMVASCSEAAVSGVSLIDSVNAVFLWLFPALATGGGVVLAQYIGRGGGRKRAAQRGAADPAAGGLFDDDLGAVYAVPG